MGVVYEAEQISLGRTVALKVLPFAAMLDERQLQRFKNEAKAAATLEHPHIVSVYGIGQERGVHYYAMRMIAGQSLSDVIADLRRLASSSVGGKADWHAQVSEFSSSPVQQAAAIQNSAECSGVLDSETPASEADGTTPVAQAEITTKGTSDAGQFFRSVARLGIQAAEALDHAHSQGILHRDIKPANLMLDATGNLYITDFGLARIESDAGMTMSGDLLGTIRYMSPEQALAKRVVVDHRSDVYSLGATLYELSDAATGIRRKRPSRPDAADRVSRTTLAEGHRSPPPRGLEHDHSESD